MGQRDAQGFNRTWPESSYNIYTTREKGFSVSTSVNRSLTYESQLKSLLQREYEVVSSDKTSAIL